MTTIQTHTDGLCDTCSKINIYSYFRQAIHCRTGRLGSFVAPTQDAVALGDLEDILDKSVECSFCRIVIKAICHRRHYSDKDPKAVLASSRSTGKPMQCWMYSYLFAESPAQDTFRIAISTHMPRGRMLTPPSECHAGDIQLVAEDGISACDNAKFHGRRVNELFDVGMARSWLRLCETAHGERCSDPDGEWKDGPGEASNLGDMLVIDVEDLCLRDCSPGTRYITLSYCWPSVPGLTNTSATLAELRVPGCLKEKFGMLPGTITDAIRLVKEMGEKYLWIDALCIIQDSEEHKQKQIMRMDSIYAQSVLTIVSAYRVPPGESEPCRGLPGIRQKTRSAEQQIEKVRDHHLAIPFDTLLNTVGQTRWNSRAWTFQESMLAKRCLYFTDDQAYFQCASCLFCEDSVGEGAKLHTKFYRGTNLWNNIGPQVLIDNHGEASKLTRRPYPDDSRATRAYEDLMGDYSSRALSDPRDILNAFQGVQNVLKSSMQTRFWYGLPERYLDTALLWTCLGVPRRQTHPLHTSADGSEEMHGPTWSWTGWRSSVEFGNYFYMTSCTSEVPWFAISRRGDQAALLLHVASFFHSIELTPANRLVRPQVPPPDDFLDTVVPRETVDFASENWRFPRYLACQTMLATFTLIASEVRHLGRKGKLWRFGSNMAVFDGRRRWAGSMMLDRGWVAENVAGRRAFEFILLSRGEFMGSMAHAAQFQPVYFDEARFEVRAFCLLNVMMVERRGDVARRLGVAIVHEDAWVEAQPRPMFVKLE
ncbi:het-domain-containing protein [Diplodia corticola]|uniref:Het-domain-containing protein n=1 Tax=Diplodia corticola TaxID=236234 RepID=A0A1J9R3R3_9PEZI|nr:het-domain-containing protein [Diplodia corticola]OJD35217.1 het-domain-containing protein [Diplodia corticola]